MKKIIIIYTFEYMGFARVGYTTLFKEDKEMQTSCGRIHIHLTVAEYILCVISWKRLVYCGLHFSDWLGNLSDEQARKQYDRTLKLQDEFGGQFTGKSHHSFSMK
jgi:hypothetical protein